MKNIIWEDYLDREELQFCSLEDIQKEEKKIGHVLPNALKKLMMEHGGQSPENIVPKYPNDHDMLIDCLYHAFSEDDEDHAYTIPFATACLANEDYLKYVPFGNIGNAFLTLDYNIRATDPPVVMVIRDSPPNDPDHRHFLAENFDAFLEKFTV